MSKQLEAELRAERKAADDAVDVAMGWVDQVMQRAIGAKIQPGGDVALTLPVALLMEMSQAVNAWRRTRGTLN